MCGVTRTSANLLVRVRQTDDGQAWAEFAEIYTPYVYRFCRRSGLQDADARDVTQDVFEGTAQQVRREFRESTWKAFWQTAAEGASAKDVAERLGTTRCGVYIAKSRVLTRFRQLLCDTAQ